MRTWARWILAIALVAAVLATTIYFANPLGTASHEFGARLWGRATLTMPSKAMEPTLVSGYELVVDTSAYRKRTPGPGELLVYFGDQGPQVGRVVALPGERLAMRLGDVFVDEQLKPAPEGVQVPTGSGPGRDLPEIQVPPGHVFVLVDNRDLGGDSRESGPIPANRWVGKVVAVRR